MLGDRIGRGADGEDFVRAPPPASPPISSARVRACGATITHVRVPRAECDAALAVMSEKPRMLYDYFKQRFAQVTNPPIDSIREEVIMALECYIGPEQNLLQTEAKTAHRLRIPHPILTNDELASISALDFRGWRTATIDITYPANSGEEGLQEALARINAEASQAISDGYSPARRPVRTCCARVPVGRECVRHIHEGAHQVEWSDSCCV